MSKEVWCGVVIILCSIPIFGYTFYMLTYKNKNMFEFVRTQTTLILIGSIVSVIDGINWIVLGGERVESKLLGTFAALILSIRRACLVLLIWNISFEYRITAK